MHRLFAGIAATLLAVHSVLGCCGHHAHACPPECIQVELQCSCEAQTTVAVHSGQQAPSAQPAHRHQGAEHCRASACVFLTKTSEESANWLGSARDGLLMQGPAILLPSSPTHAASSLVQRSIDCPPLRLHLLNQVLLI